MDGDRDLPVQPFTSQIDKAESIASTAVRTADKINVSSCLALLFLPSTGTSTFLVPCEVLYGACMQKQVFLLWGYCFACPARYVAAVRAARMTVCRLSC